MMKLCFFTAGAKSLVLNAATASVDERRRQVEKNEVRIDPAEIFLQDRLQPETFERGQGVHVLNEEAVIFEQGQNLFPEQLVEF